MKHLLNWHVPKWIIVASRIVPWIWFILFYTGAVAYLIYRLAFNHEPVTFTEVAGGYAAKRYHDNALRDRRHRFKRLVFGK